MAVSPATSFTLAEEGGVTLTLTDRFLPYRPVSIQGKQRAEFTWYPGNPEATVQMLGPDEGVIQLRGYWKDRFIQDTASTYIAPASDSSIPIGALSASLAGRTVADLVQAVDAMRRMGRRITLTWDTLVRVGHITGFTQTWHNQHDVEWEIDFSVVSQGEATVPTATPFQATSAEVYAAVLARLEVLAGTRNLLPPELTLLQRVNALLVEFENNVFNFTQVLYNTAANITQYAAAPGDIARRTAALASGIVTQASVFSGAVVDRALSDLVEFGFYGGEDQTPYGIQMNSANWRRSLRNAVQAIAYNNAITRNQIQQNLNAELTEAFVASEGMDLRDVSTRYYGTQNEWVFLMEYNGLRGSRLSAGQVVYVPRTPTSSGAGTARRS